MEGRTSFRVTCPPTLGPAYDSDFLSSRIVTWLLLPAANLRVWFEASRNAGNFMENERSKKDMSHSANNLNFSNRAPLSLSLSLVALSPSLVHHHLLLHRRFLLLCLPLLFCDKPSSVKQREAPREHRTRDWRAFFLVRYPLLLPARELFTVHCLGNASRISRAEPR